MKKRVLLIITISIIVILVSVGVIYFISYKNSNFANVEYESSIGSIPENIVNDTEAIDNEVSNIISNETENNVVTDKTVVAENKTTNSSKNNNLSNNKSKTKSSSNSSKKQTTAFSDGKSSDNKNNVPNGKQSNQSTGSVSKNKKEEKHVHAFKVNAGWFKTEEEAEKKVDEELAKWDRKLDEDIKNAKTEEEKDKAWNDYVKNCPNGYETFRCSCGMYGLNFTYR